MSYDAIRRASTCIKSIPPGCRGVHESVLRGYQILSKVKELLKEGTSAGIVLELIELMESPLPESGETYTMVKEAD